jgi:ABC-type Fe3+-hydroxamate transport system substrate-binding protein
MTLSERIEVTETLAEQIKQSLALMTEAFFNQEEAEMYDDAINAKFEAAKLTLAGLI